MQNFYCKIATSDGRVVEQTRTADSKTDLKKQLEDEGNYVLEVSKERKITALFLNRTILGRFKNKEFLMFNQEFAVLIRSGLSIVAALDTIIEKGEETRLIKIIKKIRNDIFEGQSVSHSFGKYSDLFTRFYVACLQAGEKSGDIPLSLLRYIEYSKKTAIIRQKVISASTYPLILTVVSIFTLFFLLIYVVPSLTEVFDESGSNLPAMTLLLVDLSRVLKSGFIYIVIAVVCIYTALLLYIRTDAGRLFTDKLKLHLPFLGNIFLNYSIAKLFRTLATVLDGGIHLVEAVKISSDILNNLFLQNQLNHVLKRIKEGSSLSDALFQVNIFPSMAIRMIGAGEGGGALVPVLNEVAEFYENDVEARLSTLTSTIEPALMIIMGLLIGFIVLAMYMPIFQMAGTVG